MRIAVFPGGGIKGYASALVLERLEQQLGRRVGECVDLCAGTSTGAIIACGTALGMEASKIAELYRLRGPKIFPRGMGWLARRLARIVGSGLSAPRYSDGPLREALSGAFGDLDFGDLPTRTLITAYRTDAPGFEVFKSWRPNPSRLRVWEVVIASASAPGYFPGSLLPLENGVGGFVDGGLGANDPSLCAVSEVIRLGARIPQIKLISIGTAGAPDGIPLDAIQTRGFAQWAPDFLPHTLHAQATVMRYCTDHLLKPDQKVGISIPLEESTMDDASPTNMLALERAAARWAKSDTGLAAMDAAVRMLT